MVNELPKSFLSYVADLTSHPITGIAYQGDTPFSMPLITQVEVNLWQGGTPADAGVPLPDYFQYVLNLYPWQWYSTGKSTKVKKVELYDSLDGVPPQSQMDELADWVNEKRKLGPTLVHCQAGLNRSGLVTAYALMKSGMTADEAIKLLRGQRSPAVLCNSAFEAWLRSTDGKA